MQPDWPRSLPLFLIWNTKSARQRSTICFWASQTKRNESLFTRVRMAKPRHPRTAFTGALAQLVHSYAATGVRTTHHAAGLWRRPRPANWHAQLAGAAAGLLALPRAGHPGLHGIHGVLLSVALRGLHTNALPEIVGRSIDYPDPARTRGLGR